jgi:hypothetical protein
MITRDDPGVAWLLASDESAIRWLTLTEVLQRGRSDPEVIAARQAFADGPIVRALCQDRPGHVYAKWHGAFWRLTALVELGAGSDQTAASDYLRNVLEWLDNMERHRYPPLVAGRSRAHALWHGHALAAAVALGWKDARVPEALAGRLIRWQWSDGGWNCDRRPAAASSSVHESLGPLWGLAAYQRATGDADAARAAARAVDFFLDRRLFKSRRSGEVIQPAWLRFRHPAFWHYDVLQALWVLARAGYLPDPRANDAIELVLARRRSDGRWDANGRWWRPPGAAGPQAEAADWGPSRPSRMITLKALTVLASLDTSS